MMQGHPGVGDGDDPVADRAEGPDGFVVAAAGQAVFDGGAGVPGEVVDLGAAAVVGAVGAEVDFGAVGRDRDGRVLVEVVGQVPQAGDEGLAGGGVGGQSTWERVPFRGGGQATAMAGPVVGWGRRAAGPGGVVGQGGDVGVGEVGDLDPLGDAAFGDQEASPWFSGLMSVA